MQKTSFFFALLCSWVPVLYALDVTSLSEWKSDFLADYPGTKPEMAVQGDDADRYAWNGHYWLRAYGLMAQLSGDTSYVRYGLDLVSHMFHYTDRERYKRGEIGLQDYDEAPVDIQKRTWCRSHSTDTRCVGLAYSDSSALAIGWRRTFSGKFRNEVLNDGMITHGMLRFLAVIQFDARFVPFRAEAANLISKVKRVVDSHLRNFSSSRYSDVPGSFYYTRSADPFADWGDTTNNRLYSNPVPYNHSATMSASMLLLDSLEYGSPTYRPMAEQVLAFLKAHIRLVGDSAYEWNYSLREDGVEDVGHGHVDMSFIHVAKAMGLDLSEQDMVRFSKTARRSYAGEGKQFEFIDATGNIMSSGAFSLCYDWLDFAPWDSTLYSHAREVFELQYPLTSSWSRPMLSWANLIYMQKKLQTPVEILPSKFSRKSKSHLYGRNLLGQKVLY